MCKIFDCSKAIRDNIQHNCACICCRFIASPCIGVAASCTGPTVVDKDEGADCNVEIFIKGTQVWSMKTLLKYGSKALQQ